MDHTSDTGARYVVRVGREGEGGLHSAHRLGDALFEKVARIEDDLDPAVRRDKLSAASLTQRGLWFGCWA